MAKLYYYLSAKISAITFAQFCTTGIIATLVNFLAPTFDYILVCTLAVFIDCISAWRLSRRVRRKYPQSNDGKFKSKYAMKMFNTILVIYGLIVLGFLIDELILHFAKIFFANIIAAAFCLVNIWSILENESSCNDALWAKLAQKVMVDKAKRHFEIDMSDLPHGKYHNEKESE